MGVYIKGMKMPKRCVDCACYDRNTSDGIYTRDGCNALEMRFNEDVYYGANIHNPFEGICKGCPLVEVAETHGRLIDADEVIKTARRIASMPWGDDREKWITFTFTLAEVERLVEKSPTVIEAEEG